ncbi:MAG: hypothetical protein AABY10_03610, partial [Nanoarchaeota archaeon]
MVHKKYTWKNGKKYGPYLYENKRVDGKVVTKYHGKSEKNINFSYMILIVVLLVFFVLIFLGQINIFLSPLEDVSPTLEFSKNSFNEGEILSGEFRFGLKSGEFIPKDSEIVFNFDNETKSIGLFDIVSLGVSEGSFYFRNLNEGFGEGYGLEGEKEVFPEVNFSVLIYKDTVDNVGIVEGNSSGGSGPEISQEIQNNTEETTLETNEQIDNGGTDTAESSSSDTNTGDLDTSQESETDEQGTETVQVDTGNSNEEVVDQGFSMASGAVDESLTETASEGEPQLSPSERIVHGVVRKGENFAVKLEEGEKAKIISESIFVNGTEVSDDVLDLKIEDGSLIVSTNYSIISKGFGEGFLGDDIYEVNLSLGDLGFVVQNDSNLRVSLVYQDKELFSVEKDIPVGAGIQSEIVLNETILNNTLVEESNLTTLANQTIVLGQPVKWIKRIDVNG